MYGDHRYLHVTTHSFPTRRAAYLDSRDRVVQPVENISAAFRDAIYEEFLALAPSPELQAEVSAPAGGINYNYTPGTYDPANVIGIVYDQYINVARQRVSGVDLSGS